MQGVGNLAHMTRLINEERAAFGVSPLKRDRRLDCVAFRLAVYLVWTGIDEGPDDGDMQRDRQHLEDRLSDGRVAFRYCGENVTGGFDIEEAVENMLMRQRDIDLLRDPQFSRLGLAGRNEYPVEELPVYTYVAVFTG